ncbi:hypothetical protein F7Q99_33730 [Streptomyces kaniharaensis]|uniref:Peptide chain release factor 1 n=1 Tax=Streptomyces kaniharaensis TaxID=212423 RepID=A0A6N7L2T4_9ACTN|nr:hypothetical protein [Streptomyces kaniharaensis]MQS17019.1 hypothetical protein [Streptomyces kaniharaensis]
MDLAFLTPLLDRPGPWASVYLDTSRTTEDAAQRRALIDRASVHRLADLGTDERTCAAVRDHLASEPAADSPPGRALFAADGEVTLDVPLAVSPPDIAATWAPLPHTAPLLGLLDDAVPSCLVAAIDRTGAQLERHDLGGAAQVGTVEGPQWQGRGHRAPPADRYEWHYRHRVEDTWDRTATIIADHLARVWPESGARLLVLTGDVRQRRAVHERLPQQLRPDTVEVDGGGRADGIARDVFDLRIADAWNDHRSRHLDTVLDAFRVGVGRPGEHATDANGTETAPGAAAQGIPAVVTAARQHQLAALLLQTSGHDPERPVWTGPRPEHIGVQRGDVRSMGVPQPQQAPAADALLRCAADVRAEALLVPDTVPGPPGGLGAVLRWAG